MKVKISEIRKKIENTFKQKGFKDNDIKIITDYLIWAQASGNHTQGMLKMCGTEPIQNIKSISDIIIERETPVSQLINAGAHPSIVVSQIATQNVIEKAKQSGMGIVAVNNTFSSNGAQGYYSEQIAKNNMIGIVVSRSPGSVAPFNSIDPLFGTNPIGFSFPSLGEPCTFDIATSAMTFYGLILADSKSESISEGLAIDKNGNLTQSPKEAMNGAILPFDKNYKSSSLSMMIELLSGPLADSAFCDYKTFDKQWGSTFIAINPEILFDIDTFKTQSSQMLDVIKSSRSIDNTEIRMPGEKSRKKREFSYKTGYIEVDEVIMKELGYINVK